MTDAVEAFTSAVKRRAPKSEMFAVFDKDGRPTGFFHEAVHGRRTRPVFWQGDARDLPPGDFPPTEPIGDEPNPDCMIPADAVEISEEHYLEFIEHPGRRRMCPKRKEPVACDPRSVEEG